MLIRKMFCGVYFVKNNYLESDFVYLVVFKLK